VFSLVPVVVFLLSLALFMSMADSSFYGFSHALLRVIAVSLASTIVCIAAHGFYRYMLDRSSGL
jgi:TRAP-type C4-dicarboxylate transport system permease small subunit